MKMFGPLTRAIAVTGMVLAGGIVPSFAGTAEIALLSQYIGTWKGKGTLSGANTETVVCRMELKPGNGDKLNYSGRCSLAGSQVSVNGSIHFDDGKGRYEAAMTTNVGFSGIAIGRRSGQSIIFDMKDKNKDEAGNDLDVASSMVLKDGKISVDFKVVFVATGETIVAKIPFTK